MSSTASSVVQSVRAGGRARLGRVVANNGRDILILMDGGQSARTTTRIGDSVVIGTSEQLTVGVVSGINEPAPGLDDTTGDIWLAQVEPMGTLMVRSGESMFSRSVAVPPTLGDVAFVASASDLRRLFRNDDKTAYPVGTILGREEVSATIDPSPMISGGFAILGGQGTGKSCTLASLIRALLRHRHGVKVVLIDPYNEYSRSFGKAAECISPSPGLLPHWLLSFKEFQWAVGRNGGRLTDEEVSLLEDAIPAARVRYRARQTRAHADGSVEERAVATVNCPMPFRMLDLVSHLDKVGALDTYKSSSVQRLRNRLLSAMADPKLSIFFGATNIVDNLSHLFRRIFRLEQGAAPMSVLQFGELSSGVDQVATAVIARLAAALAEWGGGTRQTLLLIEDAARYAPFSTQEESAQLSLAALRQLGGRARKLGTTIGLSCGDSRTIHRDVIGKCSTFFVHRLTSHTEIEVVQDLLPEMAGAYLGGVSNLGVGEAIGVGQGVPVSGRIKIAPLPEAAIPFEHVSGPPPFEGETDDVTSIVRRWREAGTGDWMPSS